MSLTLVLPSHCRLYALALVSIFVSGCLYPRPMLITPKTVAGSCVEPSNTAERAVVYLINRGWRLSLAISSVDAVEQLGWFVDDIHNAPWIEVAWGDLDEVLPNAVRQGNPVLQEWFGGPVVFARGMPTEPDSQRENAELVRITITRGALDRVSLGVRGSFSVTDTGASSVIASLPKGGGSIYHGADSPDRFPSTVSWVARRLFEAGCNVEPTTSSARSVFAGITPYTGNLSER